jgi:predicted nucleic acid-binding Zn ribbon protein
MTPVRQLTSSVLGAILGRQPLSTAKVRFAWQVSAGAALARATDATLREGGTLDVRAASAHWAREVERSRSVLLERMQVLLGREAVARLTISA